MYALIPLVLTLVLGAMSRRMSLVNEVGTPPIWAGAFGLMAAGSAALVVILGAEPRSMIAVLLSAAALYVGHRLAQTGLSTMVSPLPVAFSAVISRVTLGASALVTLIAAFLGLGVPVGTIVGLVAGGISGMQSRSRFRDQQRRLMQLLAPLSHVLGVSESLTLESGVHIGDDAIVISRPQPATVGRLGNGSIASALVDAMPEWAVDPVSTPSRIVLTRVTADERARRMSAAVSGGLVEATTRVVPQVTAGNLASSIEAW